jgi:hypothetical protein
MGPGREAATGEGEAAPDQGAAAPLREGQRAKYQRIQ